MHPHQEEEKLVNCLIEGRGFPYGGVASLCVLQISSTHGGDSGLYVEGEINGVPSRMIIDTGANVTIVRTDVAKRLGGHLLYTAPFISPQTGYHIAIHGKLEKIRSVFHLRVHQIEAFNIRCQYYRPLNWRKYRFSPDLKNYELHTIYEGVEAFGIENEELPIRHIVASEDLTIPSRIECFVTGRTGTGDDFRFGLTNYTAYKNFPKGIIVAVSSVDFSEGTVLVRVANVNAKVRIIKKGGDNASSASITSIGKGSGETALITSGTLFQEILHGSELDENREEMENY